MLATFHPYWTAQISITLQEVLLDSMVTDNLKLSL